MASTAWEVEKSSGGKVIKQHTHAEAARLGLKVEVVSWSTDLVVRDDKYILTVVAKTGTNEIRFSRDEVEQCSGTVSAAANGKIEKALKDVL